MRQKMYFLMWYLPRHTTWSDASDVPTVSWASSPIFAMHTERSKAARVFSLIRPSLDHRAKQAIIALIEQARAVGSNLSCFEIRFHRVVRSDLVTLREGCCNKHSWSAFVGRPQVQNNCQGSLIHKGNWPPPAPEIRNQKCHWNKYYCCQGEKYIWLRGLARFCADV